MSLDLADLNDVFSVCLIFHEKKAKKSSSGEKVKKKLAEF